LSYRRKKRKGQKEELLKDLPHEKKLCTLAEEDRFCETCSTPLVSVGEEFVRTEIEFIPAKIRVIDYYRETFECRKCRKNGMEYMEKSPMPYLLEQSRGSFIKNTNWLFLFTIRKKNGEHWEWV
jgi:transposase